MQQMTEIEPRANYFQFRFIISTIMNSLLPELLILLLLLPVQPAAEAVDLHLAIWIMEMIHQKGLFFAPGRPAGRREKASLSATTFNPDFAKCQTHRRLQHKSITGV